MKYYKTSAAKSKYKAQLVFITVSDYPSNELKRGYSAKLVSSGMWQGLRAAGCHVWAGKGPTVWVYLCVCVLTSAWFVAQMGAGRLPGPSSTLLLRPGRPEHGDSWVGKERKEKKKVGEEAGRERKQRKREAGSSTVVCGHSLHGLLNKERTW